MHDIESHVFCVFVLNLEYRFTFKFLNFVSGYIMILHACTYKFRNFGHTSLYTINIYQSCHFMGLIIFLPWFVSCTWGCFCHCGVTWLMNQGRHKCRTAILCLYLLALMLTLIFPNLMSALNMWNCLF